MLKTLDMIDVAATDFRVAPMPRHKVTKAQWQQATQDAADGIVTLLSLWGTRSAVHMALMNEIDHKIGILSLENLRKGFPSVGAVHAPALRLERVIADLYGLKAEHATDTRPWFDHGSWGVHHPLGKPTPVTGAVDYPFLPVKGDSLHKVAVGPVHAGIIEPGHFRFTGQGETVARLEQRFGYTHKGTDGLMQGANIARGSELAGRTSGDSTVAYSWAFSQAVEAAYGHNVPHRGTRLRAIMAELERLAAHLNDVGAVCNDAAFAMMLAQCGVLRERVMRAADTCFGHRFMRDCIVPGGVTVDLTPDDITTLQDLVGSIRTDFAPIVRLYDNTGSILARTVGAGHLSENLAAQFGAGGYVGRASGRQFDTRRDLPYGPYATMAFEVPNRPEGDVNARIWIRIDEVEQSLQMMSQLLMSLPDGLIFTDIETVPEKREGMGLVEGFRGDVFVWVALDPKGRIKRCHMRDPSWFQWPLLEAVIEDNIIADFPLCNKSFNCSYSGVDL